ncbi:MAG: hypothetical protein GF317_16650, partial [Candidatus Lokiarchaeota archaeon]|nr:hypothetical protein [Candidatus Lokiarchaeota archaeon]MBD3201150.1 hypothetical protein [Candidatus Lokiarchaeota archaeon]
RDLNHDVLYYQEPIKYKLNIVKDQKEILSTNFRIHYTDYLSLSSSLRDDYRRLVNNPISEGYVFLSRNNLIRLLQEYIRNKILEIKSTDQGNVDKMRDQLLKIDGFREIYDKILAQWEVKKEEFEYSIDIQYKQGENLSNIFPPCIKEILSKAREGENLEHTERLYLVFFLHALEYPSEEVINVFSSLPDFDREKTAYQVEFAKKKGYTPHSCDTLKSLNLCMAKKHNDKLCLEGYYSKKLDEQKKIKHPLFYVQFNKYKNLKTRENLAEGESS